MRRRFEAGLVVVAVGVVVFATAPPATGSSGGKQSFRGVIVAGRHHGRRTVLHSVVVAKGVVSGTGRIVEVPNRPGDPGSLSRDDIVLNHGRMHLISRNRSAKFRVNPRTCVFRARIEQRSRITGGTGSFRGASGSFSSLLHARGVTARESDGSCSQRQTPLQDTDAFFVRGRLSL